MAKPGERFNMEEVTAPVERWRPVPGHPGYEVSDLGRVRSVDRRILCRNGSWTPRRGQILKLIPARLTNSWATPRMTVCLNNHQRRYVYRLVLSAFVGECPEGMEACHDDGDSLNDRLSNLRWDTKSANMYDKQRHGTDHQRNKTHCPEGHLLAWPNLRRDTAARGGRGCLACHRAHDHVRKERRRGGVIAFHEVAAHQYAKIMAAA